MKYVNKTYSLTLETKRLLDLLSEEKHLTASAVIRQLILQESEKYRGSNVSSKFFPDLSKEEKYNARNNRI